MPFSHTPRIACIGLGSNLGERLESLCFAVQELSHSQGIEIEKFAPIYETEPVGPPQPLYLNSAVRVKITLSPEALLDRLLEIEKSRGRDRLNEIRFGPRTLDLDILWIEGITCTSKRLTVPHPRISERAFALQPLLDVCPELELIYGKTLEKLEKLEKGMKFPAICSNST